MKLSTWSCLNIRKQDEVTNMKIDNSSFERVEQFIYLRTTQMKENSIQKEIKSRLKSGNACYLVQNLFSSSLLTKIKRSIYHIWNIYNVACCFVWVWDVKNVLCTSSWNMHNLTILVFNFSLGLKFWYNNRILV
jgi:hypothetical protein